jgi:hypothetical protein
VRLEWVAWSRVRGGMEERTNGVMQILCTVCLNCTPPSIHLFSLPTYLSLLQMGLFYTTPQRIILNVFRQYVLNTLFVPQAPDGAQRVSVLT